MTAIAIASGLAAHLSTFSPGGGLIVDRALRTLASLLSSSCVVKPLPAEHDFQCSVCNTGLHVCAYEVRVRLVEARSFRGAVALVCSTRLMF